MTVVDVRERTQLLLRELPLIFMYHNVGEVDDDPYFLCVRPDRFEEQMARLERHGKRGVSVGELVDAMRAGRQRGLVGLTFDDGYHGVVEHALPVLARHGFSASIYLVADRLGESNVWDADAPAWPLTDAAGVQALVHGGLEVGSHGATHRDLTTLTADELESELVGSRRRIEALTGVPVRGFAYPYGAMDARSREAVRAAGYEYACAVECPQVARGSMALPRIYVGQRDRATRFEVKRRAYRLEIALKGRKR